jgi:hypothetical protein
MVYVTTTVNEGVLAKFLLMYQWRTQDVFGVGVRPGYFFGGVPQIPLRIERTGILGL